MQQQEEIGYGDTYRNGCALGALGSLFSAALLFSGASLLFLAQAQIAAVIRTPLTGEAILAGMLLIPGIDRGKEHPLSAVYFMEGHE